MKKVCKIKKTEALDAISSLRKKLDRLTYEYRFIFEQNKAPILNIKIDRCKIIVESKQQTMIFLDRAETKKFIETIRELLDSKASILSGKYPIDQPFSKDELRKLAESLDINSEQDLLDNANADILKLSKECEQTLASAGLAAANAVTKFNTEKFKNLAVPVLKLVPKVKGNGEKNELKFTKEDVERYLKNQKQNELNNVNATQGEPYDHKEKNGNSQQQNEHNQKGSKENTAPAKSVLDITIDNLRLTPFEKSSLIEAFEKYLVVS